MKEEKKNFDYKTIAVAILVLLALAFVIYFLNPVQTKEPLSYDRGMPLAPAKFADSVKQAGNIYIVMDIRNVSGDKQQGNILQCGTDFAGSEGLVGKELIVYALEEKNCTSLDRMLTTDECIANALGGVAIFIRPGEGKTIFYESKAIVGMGLNYSAKECSVRIKDTGIVVPKLNETNNSTNDSGIIAANSS
jgi:hypothetical protein